MEAAANLITNDALDPDGKIPEFKFCSVKLMSGRRSSDHIHPGRRSSDHVQH